MSNFVLVVPSYQKLDTARELIKAVEETANDVDILFVAEEEEYKQYCTLESRNVFVKPSRGKSLGSAFNASYPLGYDYIGFINDDHHPRTNNWDTILRDELRGSGKYSIIYPNDLFQKENLATAIFMTGAMYLSMPYVCPPSLDHLYIDNWWMDFGRRMPGGLIYKQNVIFEHMHPDAGKAERSEQYARVNSKEAYDKDRRGYDIALQHLQEDVNTTWNLILEREFSSVVYRDSWDDTSQQNISQLEMALLGSTRGITPSIQRT